MVHSEDLSKSELLLCAIYITCLVIIATPFYIYGLLKWFQFRSHFIITKRFPFISTAIIILSYINLMVSIRRLWVNYKRGYDLREDGQMSWRNIESGFSQGTSFIITAAIIERLILIYLRWKRSESKLNKVTDTIQDTNNKAKMPIALNSFSDMKAMEEDKETEEDKRSPDKQSINHNLYKHWISIIWLIYVLSAYFLIQTKYIYVANIYTKWLYVGYTWTLMLLFGIICLFWIICAKVKEGIGCLKEAYLTLGWILIIFPLRMSSVSSPFLVIAVVTIGPLQGLLPIYFSLYHIYKSEKTLNIALWQNKHKSQIYLKARGNVSPQFDPTAPIPIDVDLPCLVFLERYQNYEILSEYLAHCFALENLLFVERVSVFNQICKMYSKQVKEEEKKKVHRIKFRYSLYNKIYNDRITNILWSHVEDYSFDHYKKILYSICKEIFYEFIMIGSEHEVNLSFETKSALTVLLEGNMDTFKSWQDFMNLFDESLVEIYALIISVYQYRFKAYVASK